MGFSRQESCSGLPCPCPSPGDLPDPGIEPASPCGSSIAGRFFPTEPLGKPYPRGLVYSFDWCYTHPLSYPDPSLTLECSFSCSQWAPFRVFHFWLGFTVESSGQYCVLSDSQGASWGKRTPCYRSPPISLHLGSSMYGGKHTAPDLRGVCVCVSLMLEVSGGFQTACRRIGFGNVCWRYRERWQKCGPAFLSSGPSIAGVCLLSGWMTHFSLWTQSSPLLVSLQPVELWMVFMFVTGRKRKTKKILWRVKIKWNSCFRVHS